MRRFFVPLMIAAAVLAFNAAAGFADNDLPDIGAHRHFVLKGDRLVEVGPRLCDDPKLQKAFNQFHFNVHHPIDGSKGLHNGNGAEITSTGC